MAQRTERLNRTSEKTAAFRDTAESFASNARKLREQAERGQLGGGGDCTVS